MIQAGAQNMMTGHWWTALFPGLALALTVLGFSLFGDNLRVYLDPVNRR
jgi:peptide/nickel transport system permease protein